MDTARPRLTVLSKEQKQKIHEAVCAVLEKTGSVVKEPRAREVFHGAGAEVDGERVCIPSKILNDAIERAPSVIQIYDRDGDPAMELGTDSIYFGAHADTPEVFDFYSGKLRGYRLDDAAKTALLCDALPNIDWISLNGFAEDISDPSVIPALVMAQMMRHSSKPLGIGCCGLDDTALVLEVAATVRRDRQDLAARPFFYYYSEPTSPLTHSPAALGRLMMVAELGIPVVYTPMVMAGATGPATLAGTIVQTLADALPGLVLAQAVRPGCPCITGGIPSIMDMSTTLCSYGAPEMSLMSAALTEMVKFYRLPMFGTGGCTDAPDMDGQLAAEATFSLLSSALSGAHLVHDVGFVYHTERLAAESFVFCDEIIAMVRSFMEGIRMDEEGLATTIIDDVGPMGNFLTEDHTLRNFKRIWHPGLMNRSMKEDPASSKKLAFRLRERAHEILDSHKPRPLSSEADANLTRVEKDLSRRP